MEGDAFFWSVFGDNPEHCPVTICSRNVPWWHYEGGMVQFLAELCDGTLEPWALPPVKPRITGWAVEGGEAGGALWGRSGRMGLARCPSGFGWGSSPVSQGEVPPPLLGEPQSEALPVSVGAGAHLAVSGPGQGDDRRVGDAGFGGLAVQLVDEVGASPAGTSKAIMPTSVRSWGPAPAA
ncbi:hypothetical protein [Streptomyces sp. NPDC091027]|uniref:hypothetical protein n=1 Tax=Streptomyces sp. NPDC091027 TaxID=3365971 RepID=UPI00381DCEEF